MQTFRLDSKNDKWQRVAAQKVELRQLGIEIKEPFQLCYDFLKTLFIASLLYVTSLDKIFSVST